MQCGITIRDFGISEGCISHGLCGKCAEEYAKEIERIAVSMNQSRLAGTVVY
jgi:hypothetical protein